MKDIKTIDAPKVRAKGVFTIELFDADTGELTSRVVKKNTVTKGLQALFDGTVYTVNSLSNPPFSYNPANAYYYLGAVDSHTAFNFYISDSSGGNARPNLFYRLILAPLDTNVTYDENIMRLHSAGNPLPDVGFALGTASTADAKQGSFSQSDSYREIGARGGVFHRVTDFPPDKGNGTFQVISNCYVSDYAISNISLAYANQYLRKANGSYVNAAIFADDSGNWYIYDATANLTAPTIYRNPGKMISFHADPDKALLTLPGTDRIYNNYGSNMPQILGDYFVAFVTTANSPGNGDFYIVVYDITNGSQLYRIQLSTINSNFGTFYADGIRIMGFDDDYIYISIFYNSSYYTYRISKANGSVTAGASFSYNLEGNKNYTMYCNAAHNRTLFYYGSNSTYENTVYDPRLLYANGFSNASKIENADVLSLANGIRGIEESLIEADGDWLYYNDYFYFGEQTMVISNKNLGNVGSVAVLDEPVTKTSANAMRVTYHLEMEW